LQLLSVDALYVLHIFAATKPIGKTKPLTPEELISVLGMLYLLFFAIAIGGALSLPSLLLLQLTYNRLMQVNLPLRTIKLLMALSGNVFMICTLLFVNKFIAPLGEQFSPFGAFYALCVTVASFCFRLVKR
jgi:hypothetical protein